MADKRIIIELKGDNSPPKEKPPGGSGGGQGSGGGSPDSPGSRQAKPMGQRSYHGTTKTRTPFTRVGAMSDLGDQQIPTDISLKDIDAITKRWMNRRKRLLRSRRKKTNARNKRKANQLAKQQGTGSNVARGTKSTNTLIGTTRQASVVLGGGRYGAAVGAAQNAAKMLGALAGPVGIAIGGLAVGIGVAIFAFKKLVDVSKRLDQEFQKIAQKIAPFSASISGALAQQNMTRTIMDMRRANTVGSGMAQYIRGRTVLEAQLSEIKTALIQRLLPIVNKALPAISDVIDAAAPIIEAMLELPWEIFTELFYTWLAILKWFLEKTEGLFEGFSDGVNALLALMGYAKKAEQRALNEEEKNAMREMAQFLQLDVPDEVWRQLEARDIKAPGSRGNVPMPAPLNPMAM